MPAHVCAIIIIYCACRANSNVENISIAKLAVVLVKVDLLNTCENVYCIRGNLQPILSIKSDIGLLVLREHVEYT